MTKALREKMLRQWADPEWRERTVAAIREGAKKRKASGVPMATGGRRPKYPIADMMPGDDIWRPGGPARRISLLAAARYVCKKRPDIAFTTRQEARDGVPGYRLYCIARKP